MTQEAAKSNPDATLTPLFSMLSSKDLATIDQGLRLAARLPVTQTATALSHMVANNQSEAASSMVRGAFSTLEESLYNRGASTTEAPGQFSEDESRLIRGFFRQVQSRVSQQRNKQRTLEIDVADAAFHLVMQYPETASLSTGLTGELLRSTNISVINRALNTIERLLPLEQATEELVALTNNPIRAASQFSPAAVRTVNACLDRRGQESGTHELNITEPERASLTALFGSFSEAFPRIAGHNPEFALDFTSSLVSLIKKHPELVPSVESLLSTIAEKSNDLSTLNEVLKAVTEALPIPIAARIIEAYTRNGSNQAVKSMGSACIAMSESIDRNLAYGKRKIFNDDERATVRATLQALNVAAQNPKQKGTDLNEWIFSLAQKVQQK